MELRVFIRRLVLFCRPHSRFGEIAFGTSFSPATAPMGTRRPSSSASSGDSLRTTILFIAKSNSRRASANSIPRAWTSKLSRVIAATEPSGKSCNCWTQIMTGLFRRKKKKCPDHNIRAQLGRRGVHSSGGRPGKRWHPRVCSPYRWIAFPSSAETTKLSRPMWLRQSTFYQPMDCSR